jgi:phosphoglycolate phosphatase
VLFDLDGTLTHSERGVVGGVLHTLRTLGMPLPEPQQHRRYLGPPLHHSFTTFHGMDDEQATKAVAVYREYYDTTGAYENEVYEGIEDLLRDLVAAEKRLAVATSKVEYAAVEILRHFNLDHYFDVITGADPGGELLGTKGLVIKHAVSELRMCDGTSVVMIGDREHDVHGATENGVACIGAGWGYGEPGELEAAGAVAVAATVSDIRPLLLP